jgi:hypothetical protein
MQLDIILRGQSNAILLMEHAGWSSGGRIAAEVERLLGFDGVADRVNLVYARDSDGGNTAFTGTGLLDFWLQQGPSGDWRLAEGTTSLLNGLKGHAASQDRGDAAAVVWLHSEYDSRNPALTADTWEKAVRFDAGQVRGTLGATPEELPFLFVSAHPYDQGSDAGHQAIRQGMERLAADPAFGGSIGARALDINADNDDTDRNGATRDYGGSHISPEDAQLIGNRLAVSLAETWAAHAKPGSPVALAGGNLPNEGPQVIAATLLDADTLRLAVAHDQALTLGPLGPEAAAGRGWEVHGPQGTIDAVAARVAGPATLDVDFAGPLPADGLLHYGWGYGRLAREGAAGRGNAVYDDHGLPIWVPATGLSLEAALAERPAPAPAPAAAPPPEPVIPMAAPPADMGPDPAGVPSMADAVAPAFTPPLLAPELSSGN